MKEPCRSLTVRRAVVVVVVLSVVMRLAAVEMAIDCAVMSSRVTGSVVLVHPSSDGRRSLPVLKCKISTKS